MLEMTNRSHLPLIPLLIPLLLFSAVSLYYIAGHHVWPLSRDQWHMYAPYFEHGFWETMLSPMSTHRHIFPFFLFYLDMQLFHGLNHFLVACGAFFNGLIILLLLNNLLKENDLSVREKVCLGIFITTELVWLLNIAQLGWGFMSTQYYLAILTFLLSIYCAHRFISNSKKYVWAGLSILCGVISTFSFGMGILVWPCLFYFLWLWRKSIGFSIGTGAGFIVCLVLFFGLPGGDDVEKSLGFMPMETLQFTLQLASGPIFHLLKSWRVLDLETCRQIAEIIGPVASICGILMLIWTIWHRPVLSIFQQLSHAMIFMGLGTAALISLTRAPVFLDIWVDRYQIWATLFWTGFLPMLYLSLKSMVLALSRIFLSFLVLLPLLAFPSQLDMGSRLYEYKVRVQKSLLSYQVGIPEKQAAIDALHWNWEHKLPFLFFVLEELKKRHKNIYYQNPSEYLGSNIETLSNRWNIFPFIPEHQQIKTIDKNQLLNKARYSSLANFPAVLPSDKVDIAAYNITASVPDEITWQYAISVNQENIINGIGIHIQHSLLPRPSGTFKRKTYNFFAVVRNDGNPPSQWYLIDVQEISR